MIIKIQRKNIGENYTPYIIAEAGINHNGSLSIAKKLIKIAKSSGADAVKFQTFKAEDLASKKSKYFKLFKKLELTDSSFLELSKFAKKIGITFLSTPFSNKAVDLLEKCNCSAFKIASGDLTNIPLIKYTAKKQKPIILSTGMGTMEEIKNAVSAVKSQKNEKIILLHSVSGYPTPPNETNLNSIPFLAKKFPYPIGFSDNGDDILVSKIACALGAKIIEKHFTFDKKAQGPDHSMSANKEEFKKFVKDSKMIHQMLGRLDKKVQNCEKNNRIFARRSIIAKTTISKNSIIKEHMVAIKRPSLGIEPQKLNKVLNKKTKRKISEDEPIMWKDLK